MNRGLNRQIPSQGSAPLTQASRLIVRSASSINATVTGVRALATAAGKTGSPRTAVGGVRAEASGALSATTPDLTVAEAVTLTSGLDVHDGMVYVPGKGLFGITNTTPAKIVKWADPDDLATYTSQAFTNDGHHGGGVTQGIVYDSSADLLYVSHTAYVGFGGGDNFGIIISSVDPDDITSIATVCNFDTGSDLNAGGLSMILQGGFIYGITRQSSDNCRLHKIDPTDGSMDATVQITGTGRQRGHAITTDGTRLYFGGTRLSPSKLAWVGWAEFDFSAHDTLQVGTTFNVSDDSTTIGSYYFINVEQEVTPSGIVKKIAKDLSSVTDIPIGYLTGVDGQYYDGSLLWVCSNGQTASTFVESALVSIDPATGAVTDYGYLDSGQTKANELFLTDTDTFVIVTVASPAQAIRVVLSSTPAGWGHVLIAIPGVRAAATAAGKPGTPKLAVTGTRAAAAAAGKPGSVTTASGGTAVTGVRAVAAAAGRAGTAAVRVTGSRALAAGAGDGFGTGPFGEAPFGAGVLIGSPKIAVTGVRAVAAGAGKAGTVQTGGNKLIAGVRALAAAVGRAGTPKVCATGARALATGAGTAGSPKVSILGVRATAATAGRAGTAKLCASGVRAAGTAAGKAGTPKVVVTGVRAVAAATGKPGAVLTGSQTFVFGTRAVAVAAGRPGTPKILLPGARATAACSGRAGSPKVSLLGVRATAAAAGRAGTPKPCVSGVRAVATSAGRSGTPCIRVTGVRAMAHCIANPGSVSNPALPTLTRRTRTSGPSASTILATRNGRTRISIGSSRTFARIPPTE